MRIRMTATAAGPGGVFASGTEVEVDDEIAEAWLEAGYAVPVEPQGGETPPVREKARKSREVAAVEAPETAVAVEEKPPTRRRAPKAKK